MKADLPVWRSFQIDGKMIDILVVVRAEKVIRRYEAIKAREAKTLAASG